MYWTKSAHWIVTCTTYTVTVFPKKKNSPCRNFRTYTVAIHLDGWQCIRCIVGINILVYHWLHMYHLHVTFVLFSIEFSLLLKWSLKISFVLLSIFYLVNICDLCFPCNKWINYCTLVFHFNDDALISFLKKGE